MQKKQSLRTRWMRNGSLILIAILLIAIGLYALFTASYYRNDLRTTLETKAQAAAELFDAYAPDSPEVYRSTAERYARAFSSREDMELQYLDTDGYIRASNLGIGTGTAPDTEDVFHAIDSGEMHCWRGKEAVTGRKIMAVSVPLFYAGSELMGVMRYVSDMHPANQQILYSVLTTSAFGLGVVLVVLLCNLYYIRTITEPIQNLTDMAKRIADGSYGIKVGKKYDDEIGVLTDTINEMSAKLASAEKLQSEFVSSVSHELRTPLTAITGWSETLLYDDAIQNDSRRGIQIISKEANRLTKMVVELLEFTRMQDGRFNLNVEELDLAAELEDLVFTYGSLLRQDGVDLRMSPCEEDVPPIIGDAERLKQVFLNIIDNAAKYGREGEYVELALRVEPGSVVVTVRDFGPGIPENELPFVKQKFYKGSSKERGSGIGLAVCEEIIARHNGELIIANAPDKGVLVTVKLPILQA